MTSLPSSPPTAFMVVESKLSCDGFYSHVSLSNSSSRTFLVALTRSKTLGGQSHILHLPPLLPDSAFAQDSTLGLLIFSIYSIPSTVIPSKTTEGGNGRARRLACAVSHSQRLLGVKYSGKRLVKFFFPVFPPLSSPFSRQLWGLAFPI